MRGGGYPLSFFEGSPAAEAIPGTQPRHLAQPAQPAARSPSPSAFPAQWGELHHGGQAPHGGGSHCAGNADGDGDRAAGWAGWARWLRWLILCGGRETLTNSEGVPPPS